MNEERMFTADEVRLAAYEGFKKGYDEGFNEALSLQRGTKYTPQYTQATALTNETITVTKVEDTIIQDDVILAYLNTLEW